MLKSTSGIRLTNEEREIVRSRLRKFGSVSNVVRAINAVSDNQAKSIDGAPISAQLVNHYLSHASARALSISVARAIYELCEKDDELKFLMEKAEKIENLLLCPEIAALKWVNGAIQPSQDMKTARRYTSNLLYEIAVKMVTNTYYQLDDERRKELIGDLEVIITRYSTK